MTLHDELAGTADDILSREITREQRHVDRVYAELGKAGQRAALVEAEGMSRGRTDRTGDVRDEEAAGLFERDAIVFAAGRRQHSLDQQYEGLVFGRLDLDHTTAPADDDGSPSGRESTNRAGYDGREVRYIGRLGVRDDDYEPLVVDWRAPAAAPFYRATPVAPLGVLRRRVLTCRGERVVGVEDDLMVTDPPDDLAIIGDGALLAALTRSRGERMRDIVATIQAHQDEAIRAPARGVTEITGGPGTGKTVVALHRAAYLLYSDRRRFESGGILVVGPSAAYTAYIERVLPSLGEESVVLRSLGDLVDVLTATRLDPPATAAIKGSLRMRRVLDRAARDVIPGTPETLRVFVSGQAIRLDAHALNRARSTALRSRERNNSAEAMIQALAQVAWSKLGPGGVSGVTRDEFVAKFTDHIDVLAWVRNWWRPVDPREVLLWLGDAQRCARYGSGTLTAAEVEALSASYRRVARTGAWSVADVALADELLARLGPMRDTEPEERGFYDVEDLDDLALHGVPELGVAVGAESGVRLGARREAVGDPAADLLRGRMERPDEYAHILVDEAQDLSPMQWRALGRRGRGASWTIVGDAAQASWPDPVEAGHARDDAYGVSAAASRFASTAAIRRFHMSTNYRNAREIFAFAAAVILPVLPDADIPEAVRETGIEPVVRRVVASAGADAEALVLAEVTAALAELAADVQGSLAVIAPDRWSAAMSGLAGAHDGRVTVLDPMSSKGLEYDATVVVDPDEIIATSPGGARVLYVALTRAAHRMHVVTIVK